MRLSQLSPISHISLIALLLVIFSSGCAEDLPLIDTLKLETSSCLGRVSNPDSCASVVLGGLQSGRVACWSIKGESDEYRELMEWDGRSFNPANAGSPERFPFKEGDEVSMRLLIFKQPLDTDQCERLDRDLDCESTPDCHARLARDEMTLRVNMWLGFRDSAGVCDRALSLDDPEGRCVESSSPLSEPNDCEEDMSSASCEGESDACNGAGDEELCEGEPRCEEGDLRLCESLCGQGVERCLDGVYQECSAVAPQEERCDMIDNDCDGAIDEETQKDQRCVFTSPGCAGELPGVYQCSEAGPVCEASIDFGLGALEVCDGVDNDCDGVIDNPLGLGEACEIQATDMCSYPATYQCADVLSLGAMSELTCQGPAPLDRCDGMDNDCDGETDEDAESSPELCDHVDNDCDGSIDEGQVCGRLIYERCAVSLGRVELRDFDVSVADPTWDQLPPAPAIGLCQMYENLDTAEVSCDTARAGQGFRLITSDTRFDVNTWIGVAWDCELNSRLDMETDPPEDLPPEHLEVLSWAREHCAVTIGYRDYYLVDGLIDLNPLFCPSISAYPDAAYSARCIRTARPSHYSMLQIEGVFNHDDKFGIAFDCVASDEREYALAQRIQSEFRVALGTHHNAEVSDGDLTWGSLPTQDNLTGSSPRGVSSLPNGQINPFTASTWWGGHPYSLSIFTYVEPADSSTGVAP